MDGQRLFQLGMDLETGATQTEEFTPWATASKGDLESTLTDESRDDHFVRRDGKVYAGTHMIIEVIGGKHLDNIERIDRAFRRCVKECGATLIHIHLHRFAPQGVSGVAILAESHISVHTWPEIGYGAFDIFMCGDADPWAAVEVLRQDFKAGSVEVQELKRGLGFAL